MQIQIEELQQVIAQYVTKQDKISEYIFYLEKSLVLLVEIEEGSYIYEKAKSKVKKIKNKMKKRKASKVVEQLEEDKQYSKKRTILLVILKRNNPDEIFKKIKIK